MSTVVYPLSMNRVLARQVREGTKETGLGQAELMRQALAFGLPKVVAALRKAERRLTTVDPLPSKQAKALYRLHDDDQEIIDRLMQAQQLASED